MSGAEEEEDEEEVFYESRDRVLSSSGSSTSASSDDDGDDRPHHRRHPAAAAALDVWTSEPAPVQERRRRLLHMMGLHGDPSSLARLEMGRSASYDGPVRPPPAALSPMSRSRSDGAAPAATAKPPLGSRSRRTSPGSSEAADPRCLIRNLDDGSEFVVDDGRPELREVGTGRQLTMEQFDRCVGRSPIVQELMRRQSIATSTSTPTPIQRSSSDSSTGTARHRRRRSSWLRSIRDVVSSPRARDDKDGRRSSSATDDSQDSAHGPEPVKVRQSGKAYKELSGLF